MSTRVVVHVMEGQPGAGTKFTTFDLTEDTTVQAALAAIDGLYRHCEPEIRAAVEVANRVYAQVVAMTGGSS